MNIFKWIGVVGIVVMSNLAKGQVAEFDQLELLFEQHHYKKVLRNSNRLLDSPEYDYSMMPTYYKSLSLFQLAQNDHWRKKHPEALEDAPAMLLSVRHSAKGDQIFKSHLYELSWLKKELEVWQSSLAATGQQADALKVKEILVQLFGAIPDQVERPEPVIAEETPTNDDTPSDVGADPALSNTGGLRSTIVESAKVHIGTPYVWAGAAPGGFDCSGFTSYVLGQQGIVLSRRSSDQYDAAKKIKQKNVQPGDLIFFNNGSGISHVGIVISKKGSPLVMIHSSSSKGIIITEVEKSEYWMKRLHGFGTYVN
ncbi:MAG: C40 family peptidase [Crocinitomicaceae bacterium]|nr:C40 family peptidase [Crocinitomicaceae bacterium]